MADEIGRSVVRGDLEPGAVLPTEVEFSRRAAVSRSAYREALRTLAAKGLVEARTRTGTRILPRARWNLLDPNVVR